MGTGVVIGTCTLSGVFAGRGGGIGERVKEYDGAGEWLLRVETRRVKKEALSACAGTWAVECGVSKKWVTPPVISCEGGRWLGLDA